MIDTIIRELKNIKATVSVEKDALQIDCPKGAMNDALKALIREHKAELITFIKSTRSENAFGIENIGTAPSYEVSSGQERLWVLSRFADGLVAYNMPFVVHLHEKIDVQLLEKAIYEVIERHEILRTVLTEDDDATIKQVVLSAEASGFKFVFSDFSAEKANALKKANAVIEADAFRPFDLSKGPLIRAFLLQVSESHFVLYYNMHHIICDGWSGNVLSNDVISIYTALKENKYSSLAPLRIQYKDYAAWQRKQFGGELFEQHRTYWMNKLNGELPVLDLQTDRSRPPVKTYRGEKLGFTINEKLSTSLKDYSHKNGGTLFMGLQAILKTLFFRYTSQEDIIIGSPVAGRDNAELDNQIGFYVNTLPFRTSLVAEDTFQQLFEKIKKETLDAYSHQVYPFDKLVEELNVKRDMSRSPLFDVLLVLQNTKINKEMKNSQEADYAYFLGGSTSKFDLNFSFSEEGKQLYLQLEYNTDLYDRETVIKMFDHFLSVFSAVILEPETVLGKIEYLSSAEKEKILSWNNTAFEHPANATVMDLFETQVKQTPAAAALVFEDKCFSYKELNKRTNQYAHYLKEHAHVKEGDTICVYIDRSEWSVITMIAVMKLGAVYVPVDKTIPESRAEYMIRQSAAKLIITDIDLDPDRYNDLPYALRIIRSGELPGNPDESNPSRNIKGIDASFIIYTSGSTGQPKGVEQTHQMLYNLITWDIKGIRMEPSAKLLQFSSFSFDSSLHDVYYSLASGGEVHVIREELRKDLWALKDYVLKNRIEILSMPYAALKVMFSEMPPESFSGHCIREVISTGEQLYITGGLRTFLKTNPDVRIINLYGPSETHVVTGISYCLAEGNVPERASIGKLLYNTSIYILDPRMQLVPEGIPGELYIGGMNLAIGYKDRLDLTDEKFISSPFLAGELLYKSGDLGVWLPQGEIKYLRRIDNQLKIRGYRIELGEIEAALRAYGSIEETVVLARSDDNNEKELAGYFVSKQQQDIQSIRMFLKQRLPDYMIPSHLIQLESMPLTTNGKVDKRALPKPEMFAGNIRTFESPQDETEERLSVIWQTILKKEKVGRNDNFFELGGHSLKVSMLKSRIYKEMDASVDFAGLFSNPLLSEQALLIKRSAKAIYQSVPLAPIAESYPLTHAQKRVWLASQRIENSIAHNMPDVYELDTKINLGTFEKAVAQLIERYEILRTVYRFNAKGELRQYVLSTEQFGFKVKFIVLDTENSGIQKLIATESTEVFDLAQGPLFRIALFHRQDGSSVISIVLHHIISDQASDRVFKNELMTLYNAFASGKENPLLPLKLQYKDYAVWAEEQLKNTAFNKAESFWLSSLQLPLPETGLIFDEVLPEELSRYEGENYFVNIRPELFTRLQSLIQEENASSFIIFSAALYLLLYEYTGQKDVIIGAPCNIREHPDLENQLGLFLNMMALKMKIDPEMRITDFISEVKKKSIDSLQHMHYPFDLLVEKLGNESNTTVKNLFDVVINVLNAQAGAAQNVDASVHRINAVNSGYNKSKFPLCIYVNENEEGIFIVFQYMTGLFRHKTIENFAQRYITCLEFLALEKSKILKELQIIQKPQLSQLKSKLLIKKKNP